MFFFKKKTQDDIVENSVQTDASGEAITVQRVFDGKQQKFIYIFGICMSLFHLWVNTVGIMPEIQRNAVHFGFVLFLGFLIYPISRTLANKTLKLDYILATLSFLIGLYLVFFEDALHARNEIPVTMDLIAASIAIILMLEITRRTSGWLIPVLAIIFISYSLFLGKMIPGMWNFPGVTIERLLYRMYFAPDGLFGTIATISSTFVFLFVLFAAFLIKSGAGEFIINLAVSLMGHTTGGPAKMAVFASGLMGSVSGSAVANTVGTGSITIPMMKKIGFSPKFAGGVEAAASTGGQLMPPIMGAGAFIMAQWTQISYLTIVAVSFIPAIMYFLSVAFFIHLRAKKRGIKPIPKDELPKFREVMKSGWNFFIPIFVLMFLLVKGYTPTYAASMGILAVVVSSWFNPKTRMGFKDILDALYMGARNMVTTGVILLCSGIIVGIVLMVGMGVKFSMMITSIAGDNIFFTILLIALASLILGMGLPVTASYIVLAVLAAPSLVSLLMKDYLIAHFGLTPEMALDPNVVQQMTALVPPDVAMGALLASHLLIFWYSQDANVTPPVCLAAYSAAGIAGSKPLETGIESWKLAKGLYIIPLMFIYEPAILFQGPLITTIENIITGTLGLFIFATFFEGYFVREINWVERIILGIAAWLLFWPETYTNIAGMVISILVWLYLKKTKDKYTPAEV
ncbi:TRAP transporter permease [Deferribacterales bacterium Es71-Z0220]|uniref:TRAP transporter permease n=1 Tax=Deferrivibrio essentukiensis TaxID=2880922 RepID=UPI001F6109CA|nr:TRAP transporter permease [Deferrivibrio essentukiensis]MCB4205219.1 TRAP transporter permease [Deferrivibrio essentukiensis]